MKLRNVSWVAGSAFAMAVVVIACSDSTGTTTTSSGGTTSSSSTSSSSTSSSSGSESSLEAAAEACGFVSGATYTTHYAVAEGSDETCMAPADETQTETFDTSDGGEADAGDSCTSSISGCTFTENCTGDEDGISSVTDLTYTISSTVSSGTITDKVTAADGGDLQNCSYTITITKQ